jgi:hypothetical protein
MARLSYPVLFSCKHESLVPFCLTVLVQGVVNLKPIHFIVYKHWVAYSSFKVMLMCDYISALIYSRSAGRAGSKALQATQVMIP